MDCVERLIVSGSPAAFDRSIGQISGERLLKGVKQSQMERTNQPRTEMSSAAKYLADHGVEVALASAVTAVIQERPADPLMAIAKHLMSSPRSPAVGKAHFRPCIDLHQGKVKQIVGSTLTDDQAKGPVTNFESSRPSESFAETYRQDGLGGGHVIMLGPGNEEAAKAALRAFPGGLQVGGGITPANAASYLEAGASHVIVTSYVFRDGRLDEERLAEVVAAVGRDRLVLDLSCRRREPGGPYFVVTDRWQKFTSLELSAQTLSTLSQSCAEFLVHAVDVEGKQSGILEDLVVALGDWSPLPVTYAGGARSLDDLELVSRLGRGRVDLAIGSALDLFGGKLPYSSVVQWELAAHGR